MHVTLLVIEENERSAASQTVAMSDWLPPIQGPSEGGLETIAEGHRVLSQVRRAVQFRNLRHQDIEPFNRYFSEMTEC